MSLQLPVPVKIYFVIGGADVDVTSYVQGLGGRNAVDIFWGFRDASNSLSPSEVAFQIFDPNGDLDWENPYSAYFGRYGLGAQVRVEIDDGHADTLVRMIGQLTRFNAAWRATAGADTMVDVLVSGLRRQDSQYTQPIRSPAYRALAQAAARASMLVYLPLEEESSSSTVASPIDAHPTVSWAGGVQFGGYADHPATPRMVTLTEGGIIFVVAPAHTASTEYRIAATWHIPAEGPGGDNHAYRMYFFGGTLDFADVVISDAGVLQIFGYRSGSQVHATTTVDFSVELLGTDVAVSVDFVQNGADIDLTLSVYLDASASQIGVGLSDTWAARTFGAYHSIAIQQQFAGEFSVGHLVVTTDTASLASFLEPIGSGACAWRGFEGEAAGSRIARLLEDAGLGVEYRNGNGGVFSAINSPLMGPQGVDTLSNLLDEAIDVDGGLLPELRDSATPGRLYCGWQGLVNQPPKFTLMYGVADGAQVGTEGSLMQQADDDFALASGIVVNRRGGATFELTQEADGYHYHGADPSVAADGIGDRIAGPFELNLFSDNQLPPAAGWRLHLASWKGRRYPQVVVDLTRSALSGSDTLIAAVRSAYVGDVIRIRMPTTGTPRYLDQYDLRLMIMGCTETSGRQGHVFRFVCRSADPWEIETVDTSGSTLFHGRNTTDTSFRLSTHLGPQWSEVTSYYLQVSGEVVRLDSLSTGTIAFIAAGTASSANNASTTPGLPAGLNASAGETLVLVSAIRNSGTGTPDVPSGWTLLADAGNVKVMARPYESGVVAPTCTYTGGAANADTWSRIFAFDELSMAAAGGTKKVPAHATQLNGSAQNIAYPALNVERDGALILYIGWKQDDWTSVATLAGATEATDSPVTAGDDMGVVVDYAIQTTATDIPAGSFTVTGGISAISRGLVLALRPTQVGTVVRGLNNVSVSPAAGAAVRMWRPGVDGL